MSPSSSSKSSSPDHTSEDEANQAFPRPYLFHQSGYWWGQWTQVMWLKRSLDRTTGRSCNLWTYCDEQSVKNVLTFLGFVICSHLYLGKEKPQSCFPFFKNCPKRVGTGWVTVIQKWGGSVVVVEGFFKLRSGLQQAAFQTDWNRCLFMTCFKKLHWPNDFDRRLSEISDTKRGRRE